MATADLITSFLNNEMSTDQEREFLLSVAASDSLRLELKSHVMLDRILVDQVQHAQVPHAVREAIFMEAGIATSAARTSDRPGSRGASRPVSNFLSKFQRGALAVLVAASGFALGYATGNNETGEPAVTSQQPVQVAPRTEDARKTAPVQLIEPSTDRATPAVTAPAGQRTSTVSRPAEQTPRTTASRNAARPSGTVAQDPAAVSTNSDPGQAEPSTTTANEPTATPNNNGAQIGVSPTIEKFDDDK